MRNLLHPKPEQPTPATEHPGRVEDIPLNLATFTRLMKLEKATGRSINDVIAAMVALRVDKEKPLD